MGTPRKRERKIPDVFFRSATPIKGIYVGRRTRVEIDLIRVTTATVGRAVAWLQGEGGELSPLGRLEGRGVEWYDVATLVDENIQRDGLPAVEVNNVGIARQVDDQRWVYRLVMLAIVVVYFVGTVLQTISNELAGQVVAQRCRIARLVVSAVVGDVIPQLKHERIVRG